MKQAALPRDADSDSRGSLGPWARLLLAATLLNFGVAQPLYDLVGRFPEFFIFRHFRPGDFFLFTLVFSVVLPLAWWALFESVALLIRRGRRTLHKVSVGVPAACVILPWVSSIDGPGPWITVLLSALVGAGLGHLLVEKAAARRFVLFLSPAVIVFASILLLRPGIRELWWPHSTALDGDGTGGSGTPPIVLLVFDALPTASLMDDSLGVDEVRYPAFARLAREGEWYRRATTVSTLTTQSLPSILSGRCPGSRKSPTFGAHPQNLFTLLGATYDLDVVETVTRLCPEELCAQEAIAFRDRFYPLLLDASIVLGHRLSPTAWKMRLPPVDKNWGGFDADASKSGPPDRSARDVEIERYREMVKRIKVTTRPTLRFAHVVLPHEPFVYMPSGTIYRAGAEPGGFWKTLVTDPWVARHGYQRHLLQLGFVDRLLGELLSALDESGLYDETLLIVTADHGSSFVPGEPRRELAEKNVIDLGAVPLLVKLPNQRRGGANDTPVQTVDVLAIIADALGLRRASWLDGRAPGVDPEAGDLSCLEIANRQAIRVSLDHLQAAADRKIELFGTGATQFLPFAGPRQDVVGISTRAASCAPLAGVDVELQSSALFDSVELASGFVPAELVGAVYGPEARDLDLAVAVNGTVRATTRPYQLGTAGATFSAIVPEDSFHQGRNEVEVFAIGADDCLLRPLSPIAAGAVSLLDTRLGAWADPRIQESGFTRTEETESEVMRWTKGRARLDVPLPLDQASKLKAVRVELGAVGREGSNVRVLIGRKELFSGFVDKAPWSATIPVGEWQYSDPVPIKIQSDVFARGKRRFGVGVTGIWLLSEPPPEPPGELPNH